MKLNSVQALRGLAALAVMIAHLRSVDAKHSGELPILSEVWINGVSGVDLFFVISGFIMVWVSGDMARGVGSVGRFLFSRITRIYPLWWLFASVMAVYFWVAYGVPWDAENLAKFQISGPQHLAASYALLPQETFPVLGVGWTLVHEMYFYLGFALLLFLPPRWRIASLALWGAGIIWGSLAGLSASFAGNLLELAFYPMTFEFIMGAFVAVAIKVGWHRFGAVTASLGAIGYVAVFLSFDFTTGGPLLAALNLENANAFTLGWGRTLFFGIPAALLLHGLVSLELNGRITRFIPGLAVRIGDWSYALYLCHMLVLSAVARLYFPLFSGPGYLDNIAFMLIAGVASVVVSALTYHIYETPTLNWFRTLRKKWFPAPPTP